MSANHDDPGKRSGSAGVHTNPANNQPVTSASIHGRNTAGNHGGYSNTLLGIVQGQPLQRDNRNTNDGTKETNSDGTGNMDKSIVSGSRITPCSFKTSQRGSDSSPDPDIWVAPDPLDTAANSSSHQDKLDRSVMLKDQNAPVTEQKKFDRSVISKDRPDVKPDQGAIPKVKPADTAANSLSDQDKLDRSVMLKGQNAPVTE